MEEKLLIFVEKFPTDWAAIVTSIASVIVVLAVGVISAKAVRLASQFSFVAERIKNIDNSIKTLLTELLSSSYDRIDLDDIQKKRKMLTLLIPDNSTASKAMLEILERKGFRTEQEYNIWLSDLLEAAKEYFNEIYKGHTDD